MKKILKIFGLAMVLSALLLVSITSAVFAAGPNTDNGTQTQIKNQGETCICGECPCEECPCGEFICNEVVNKHSYKYANSGAPEAGYKHANRNGQQVIE